MWIIEKLCGTKSLNKQIQQGQHSEQAALVVFVYSCSLPNVLMEKTNNQLK